MLYLFYPEKKFFKMTDSDLDPKVRKNVHNLLMTVQKMGWSCDLVAEMLLILNKFFST